MKTLKNMIAIVACMFATATSVQAETFPDITIKDLKKAKKTRPLVEVMGTNRNRHLPIIMLGCHNHDASSGHLLS